MAAKELVLTLHDTHLLNSAQREEFRAEVLRQLETLVRQAGRTLRVVMRPGNRSMRSELNLTLSDGGRPLHKCGPRILGEDGMGDVDIAAHYYGRVCGPTKDERRVLITDQLLAKALANTALHELGHFIAGLEHSEDLNNYMTTVGPVGGARTFKSVQGWYAGPKTWTQDQRDKLIEALRTGNYNDPLQVQDQPGPASR
jgi:hypothetical protein